MFLLNLLIPTLQIVLDFQQQTHLLLMFRQLLSQTTVVVVGVPVDRHELIQRFLQFLLAALQCIVLAPAAVQRDLQVLVVGGRRVLRQFVGLDLLVEFAVQLLEFLQSAGQLAVALAHALVHEFVLLEFVPVLFGLAGRQTFGLHRLHQIGNLLLLPAQCFFQLLRPFSIPVGRFKFAFQFLQTLLCMSRRLCVGLSLFLEGVLQQRKLGVGIPLGVLHCRVHLLLQLRNSLIFLLNIRQEQVGLLLEVVDLLLQSYDIGLLLPQLLTHPLIAASLLLAVPPILLELTLQRLLLRNRNLMQILGQPQFQFQLLHLPVGLLGGLLGAEVDVAVEVVVLEVGDVGLLLPDDLLDSQRLDVAVLPRTEGVQVFLPLRGGFGVGGVETVDEQGQAAVDVCALEVGELLGHCTGGLQTEGDGDEFMLVGGEGESFGSEGELLGVVEAEVEVGDGLPRPVDHLDRLHALPPHLHHLRLDRHRLATHTVRIQLLTSTRHPYRQRVQTITTNPYSLQ